VALWLTVSTGVALLAIAFYLVHRLRKLHKKRLEIEQKLKPMYEELEEITEETASS